jgi:general secretion pathway protein D
LIAVGCWAASSAEIAQRLAERAKKAQAEGETVRAYLLLKEAVSRDPKNPTYRANRDALASAAKLLMDAHIESADIASDIKAAEQEAPKPAPSIIPVEEMHAGEDLRSIPHIEVSAAKHSFDLRADEPTLFRLVGSTYGLRASWDPQLISQQNIRFHLDDVDLHTALEALTAVTNTFVFPISTHEIFFARDTEEKRNEMEPTILLTMPLPNALGEKDLIEAANAVRGTLNLRAFGWDSTNRTVLIRDKVTRAQVARALLEAVLLPKAQVSLEVQVLTVDSENKYHYGSALQASFQLIDFGHIGHFETLRSAASTAVNYATFGGGSTLLGLGITNSTVFAIYSKSFTRTSYDAVVIAEEGQAASLHFGEKYPIPTTLYTGVQQSTPSIYNPIGQVTQEDLGLVLKLTPRVNGWGEIALDVEAEYKSLGTQTFNTVPSVDQRKFTGTVGLREGEWAVLAGLDQKSTAITRNGLAGLANIRGLNQALSENTHDRTTSDVLVVIKPTITRLPMSPNISPQYLLGPLHGERVLL